jgi:LPS export ABC transporter protein LptC
MVGILIAAAMIAGGCSDSSKKPPVSGRSALADSADQVMYGARFNLTEQGVLHAQLLADTAYFFDDNTRVELMHVNSTFFTSTGVKNAVLTGRRGTYHTATGTMEAHGNVIVNSVDGRRLTTEQLKYDQGHNEMSSDSAFVLTEPDRRLQGIGFRSDPNLQNVHVLNVLSGTPGAFNMPSH